MLKINLIAAISSLLYFGTTYAQGVGIKKPEEGYDSSIKEPVVIGRLSSGERTYSVGSKTYTAVLTPDGSGRMAGVKDENGRYYSKAALKLITQQLLSKYKGPGQGIAVSQMHALTPDNCMPDASTECSPTGFAISYQGNYFGNLLLTEDSLDEWWWDNAYYLAETWWGRDRPWERDPRLSCREKLDFCMADAQTRHTDAQAECTATGTVVGGALTVIGGAAGAYVSGGVLAAAGAGGGAAIGAYITLQCLTKENNGVHPKRLQQCWRDKQACDPPIDNW